MPDRKSQPIEHPDAVQAASAKGGIAVLRLRRSDPRDAKYVAGKLKALTGPTRIYVAYGDKTVSEMEQEFNLLVDLVNADVWMRATLLKVDYENHLITFGNYIIVEYIS